MMAFWIMFAAWFLAMTGGVWLTLRLKSQRKELDLVKGKLEAVETQLGTPRVFFHIAAQNASHAEFVARHFRLNKSQWSYVHSEHDLRGMWEPFVIVYETAEKHPDWLEIREELGVRRARVFPFLEPGRVGT